MKENKTMEALLFGIIAVENINGRQEQIVPEPAEFQEFDLRTLEYVAQTVS
jgi:hypothetical protein